MNYWKTLPRKFRPGTNPHTKPRVYFSYHPNDLGCLNHISNMILAQQDCAIYYYDYSQGSPDPDELSYFLKSVRFILIPISEEYLDDESFSYSFEYAFAVKNNIPILPLLKSESLSARFNERFGERQYLTESAFDETMVPFEEKLARFLRSVMLSDETIKRIHSSFAGQVFLSYRKKDRSKIGEFMQLIHRDDRCRDISFWYDEDLTPGEDFSEELRLRIEGSDLFVLLATEHIYESGNYVLEKEYPFALQSRKPIIAVTYEGTDRKAFLSAFSGLSDVFVISAQKKICDAVVEKMGINDSQKEDPEHLFLIGLAYLSGIGVERNPHLAIELIEQAAGCGLPGAMSKAAQIYHVGDGADRDIHKAVAWQKKYVERLKELYKKNSTREAAIRLYYQRESLISYCCEASLYDDALRYSDENKAFEPVIAETLKNKTISLVTQAQALWSRGRIYERQGNAKKAEECVLQALHFVEAAVEGEKASYPDLFYPAYGIVGACFFAHRKYEAAAYYLQKSLACLSQSDKTDPRLVTTLLRLGQIYGNQSSPLYDYDKTEKYYLNALEISEATMKSNPKWGDYSFVPYYSLVSFYDFHNRPELAERYILTSIHACRELLKSNPKKSCEVLTTVLYNAGGFYGKYRCPELAMVCYTAAEKQCEFNVLMNPGWDGHVSHLKKVRLGISQFCFSIGKEPLAAHFYQKAMGSPTDAVISGNRSKILTVLDDFDLPQKCIELADLFAEKQSFLSAEKYYLKGIGIYQMMISHDLGRSEPELAKVENKTARFYEISGENKIAETHYKEALSIWKTLAQKDPQQYQATLTANYTNLGQFYKRIGKPDRAMLMLMTGILEADEYPDLCKAETADAYDCIGQLYEERGEKALARQYYSEALSIYEELAKTDSRYVEDVLEVRKKLNRL